MTDQEREPESAKPTDEPTPELPESAADLEPQSTPLAHDEPAEAHAHDHDPAVGDPPVADHAPGAHPGEHVDVHDAAHGDGHDEPRLGPIDWSAWGYAVVGAVIALVLIGAFWVAAYQP